MWQAIVGMDMADHTKEATIARIENRYKLSFVEVVLVLPAKCGHVNDVHVDIAILDVDLLFVPRVQDGDDLLVLFINQLVQFINELPQSNDFCVFLLQLLPKLNQIVLDMLFARVFTVDVIVVLGLVVERFMTSLACIRHHGSMYGKQYKPLSPEIWDRFRTNFGPGFFDTIKQVRNFGPISDQKRTFENYLLQFAK
jgi:hypothetical protein